MNIIHIGKFYPPYRGGMESYLGDLAAAQVRQGHQVTVIVHNHHWRGLSSQTTTENIDGVTVIRLKSLRPIFHTPIMLGLNRCVKQIINQKDTDIIHVHGPNPSLFWLLFNQPAKATPWILSWHSDMVTQHSSAMMKLIYLFVKPFENRLIKHSKQILVSSQNYACTSIQLKKHPAKVKVIPLGISTRNLQPLSSEPNQMDSFWPKDRFRLFSLGRLTFYKNHQMLIEAMTELEYCYLNVAGGGQLATKLQEQISHRNLEGLVNLLGEISEQQAQQLFNSCDVFCLASHDRAESFGVVLLEAMYHNKIILVADTAGSGMKWLAENYNKGFTFKANDVDDFRKQVHHIRKNLDVIMARPPQFDYDIDNIAQAIELQSYTPSL